MRRARGRGRRPSCRSTGFSLSFTSSQRERRRDRRVRLAAAPSTTDAIVLPSPFWFESIRTPRRRAFDHSVVASFGCVRAIAPATISANARVSSYVERRSIGTRTWKPLPPRRLRERLEPELRRAAPSGSARPRPSASTARRASGRGRRGRSPAGRACRRASTTRSCRCSPCSPSRAARARRSRAGSRSTSSSASLSRVETSARKRRDPVGHVRRRVLLEERLAVRRRRDSGAS